MCRSKPAFVFPQVGAIIRYSYQLLINNYNYNNGNYQFQAGAMLTMTHSTSLRASPQVP